MDGGGGTSMSLRSNNKMNKNNNVKDLKRAPLPDSTMADAEEELGKGVAVVSVDTALNGFPDVAGIFDEKEEEDILDEVMSCIDNVDKIGDDKVHEEEDSTKVDILAKALSETDSIKEEQPESPQNVNLVSSTILGFPEVENNSEEDAEDKETQQILANVTSQQPTQPIIILNNTTIPGMVQMVQPPPPPPPPSDVFTLALADGSIVQLRVQQPPTANNMVPKLVANDLAAKFSQQQQEQQQPILNQNDEEEMLVLPAIPPERATSNSPPSVAEEVILPFSNPTTPTDQPSLPPSPAHQRDLEQAVIRAAAEASMELDEDSDDLFQPGPSTAFRSNSLSSSCSSSDLSDLSSDPILSVFTSAPMDSLTIESLRAQLTNLPEGQSTDLGALLTAARIDLTVEDIVRPPLTQVKRTMEARGLADWQIQLCIKIRRRKKNTAAVRSSRRKRSQYVVGLREEVVKLRSRRRECQEENQLLRQLHSLWARLVQETERELQEGVQSHFNSQNNANSANVVGNVLTTATSVAKTKGKREVKAS